VSLIPAALQRATVLRADFTVEPYCPWPRQGIPLGRVILSPAARAAAIRTAYFGIPTLPYTATGAFMSYVIGKLSHDKLAHPGTRVEKRFSHTVWHCPCGATFMGAGNLHRHVARLVTKTAAYPMCPVTLAKQQETAETRAAADQAERRARMARMTDAELDAYIASLSA
jgi:hypothetical protein